MEDVKITIKLASSKTQTTCIVTIEPSVNTLPIPFYGLKKRICYFGSAVLLEFLNVIKMINPFCCHIIIRSILMQTNSNFNSGIRSLLTDPDTKENLMELLAKLIIPKRILI